MELNEFRETIKEFKEKAIKIVCALNDYNKTDVESVSIDIDEEEIEVFFSISNDCSCCPDDTFTAYVKLDDLVQDIDSLVIKQEEKRVEDKRKKEEAKAMQIQKDAGAKEKRERDNYERLKKKYDKL